DIIVIINPIQSFTEPEIQMLTTYLENGGRVLLMDSITNTKSTANELVGTFGIWITTNTDDHRVYHNLSEIDGNSPIGNITSPYLALSGGKRILIAGNNETYASMIEFSNETTGNLGKLVVVVDSYTFSDAVMGGTFTEPTERQRQIYETEFFLLDSVLKK
ncbi:MAG: GldG family protein, partial [Thermoplasmata archaeon]|nr:GldG family protein [Thermoplasmata archaeon]